MTIKGITIYPDDPFKFDFIMNTGNSGLEGEAFKAESRLLISYFLASLTTPEEDMWVNLSPEEKDRVIPENLGSTGLGVDMLAQDYLLKQLTASMIYPENDLGRDFWARIYKKVYALYGHMNVPVNTFNKVWILPDQAEVYEKGENAFIVTQHLKVLLEEDYKVFKSHLENKQLGMENIREEDAVVLQDTTSDIVREVLIPEIEKEVNHGKNFAKLRQIFSAMILATWYKKALKDSLLGQVYVDQAKTKGVDVEDKELKQKIYNQYIEAFKKGVFNYIKEDYDQVERKSVPRKYFSGGIDVRSSAITEKNLSVLSGPIQQQPPRVREAFTSPLGENQKVAVGLVLAGADQDLLNAWLAENASSPIVEAVDTTPPAGGHVTADLNAPLEVDVRIRIQKTPVPLDINDLIVTLHTELFTEEENNFIRPDEGTLPWRDIVVPSEKITPATDSAGRIIPNVFNAKVDIVPTRTGAYAFKVNARTRQQDQPVWVQGENTTVQVDLLPTWLEKDQTHPMYVFQDDVKLRNFPANWTGLNAYLKQTAEETGKNFFMISPFFPTQAESPFAPVSVYALSPRLIDWQAVEDRGEHPFEKFRDFQNNASQARREAFARFRHGNLPIQQYADLLRERIQNRRDVTVYGVNYSDFAYLNSEEISEYLIYEQFVNLEQLYALLKYQQKQGNHVVGDLPFFRSIVGVETRYEPNNFAHDGANIDNPGFMGNKKVRDLAAWDELAIDQRVQNGEKDPRMLPFEYWSNLFHKVFLDRRTRIHGWRIDAFHMYGRGSSKDNAARLVWGTSLWEEFARYFKAQDLFLMAEQLGGDAHAYYHFQRLGLLQNAFILDLKGKNLSDFLSDLALISRGLAVTVVDTHDSARWAEEYFRMFEDITGLAMTRPDDWAVQEKILNLAGPIFLGLLTLGPKLETVLLSLGEYATQAPIKREFRDEKGESVIGSAWGTAAMGRVDLSSWLKQFTRIREENPEVSRSEMVVLSNNSPQNMVSVAKVFQDNKLLFIGNFYKEAQTMELPVSQFPGFRIAAEDVAMFRNVLTTEEEVRVEQGKLTYPLAPGQVAVLKLESVQKPEPASSPVTQRWNWTENKNKAVMVSPGDVLLIENEALFELQLIEENTGRRQIIPSQRQAAGGIYQVELSGLPAGDYALTFRWPAKTENDGWEGEHGIRFYHFKVLPEALPSRESGLSIRLNKDDLNAYPHNTVTLSNGIGTILRLPVRPLNRDPHDGGIRVGGYVSKYDGFLVNLMKRGTPDETKRVVFRGTVDDVRVRFADGSAQLFPLDTATFQHFERYPLPSWTYIIKKGPEQIVIEKTAVIKQGENTFAFQYRIVSMTRGVEAAELFVRPDMDQRSHHETTSITPESLGWWHGKHRVMADQAGQSVGFELRPIDEAWSQWYPGFTGVRMTITRGRYQESPERHYSENPLEAERGQQNYSDTYSPGFFSALLKAGDSTSLVLSSEDINTPAGTYAEPDITALVQDTTALIKERLALIQNKMAQADPFVQKLVLAMWEFIVERDEFYTVIAGHPWFSDWGRDTFIAFDGILAAGMNDVARGLILAFGKFEGKDGNKGMLPNIITGAEAGNWDTVDAPLLYVLAVRNYIQSTGDAGILETETGGRTVRAIIESIAEGYQEGTKNGIRMDAESGLIYSPPHFTWMDTNYPAATPREGYTVENNARWFDVLSWLSELSRDENDLAKAESYARLAARVKENFNTYFWNEHSGYLSDTIVAGQGVSAQAGRQDLSIRPNQLIAVLSAYELLSPERQQKVVDIVAEKLLVPTGLRTLSEDTQSSEEFPYRGTYEGSDDDGRKQAYHNGTVWPHLFGDWALAYVTAYNFSPESIRHVLPYFAPLDEHLGQAGVGSISEVRDGNYPHRPRGTDAQAWSVALPLAAYMKIRFDGQAERASSPLRSSGPGVAELL
ncbi:MAG TPA: amylo-alpha-1,6-glucosidase, partial [Candidatus Omnitrophota bacterium]|nr:amylo-alpha-1,6-glucosidase [Candidatus Omnitrophota bacterium]